MTKFTVIRTDKKNVQHVKLQTIEEIMKSVRSDFVNRNVQELREYAAASEYLGRPNMSRLPKVHPAFEAKVDKQGDMQIQHINGLLTLSIGLLDARNSREEARSVKRMVSILPTTVAAFMGSSGKTVKVIVSISRPDGSMPQNDEDAEKLFRQAYPLACRIYGVALDSLQTVNRLTVGSALRDGTKLLYAGFRMSYDDEPYVSANAVPLLIPEEMSELPYEDVREVQKSSNSTIAQHTQSLIDLLESRYSFRANRVMGYVEYFSKNHSFYGWRPVDERVQNSMVMEARLEGLDVRDRDGNRFLKSGRVKLFDPVNDYLQELYGKWDGRDYIGELAARVPTNNPLWPKWFQTWFLAMVEQWQRSTLRYGNSMVPLLISKQGYNKSTFCKSILPSELQWGYNDSLVLSEKKSVLQAMSQFLLINLDEFNQISPKVQEGFLKNVVQLASVKVKPPYGKHVENFPRRASFIATANVSDILTDPTGSRRFIGIELTGPINMTRPINYRQLYAQAVDMLSKGTPHWLDEEQTREVMASNQQFQQRSAEEMYFLECFDIAENEAEGTWMSATAIFNRIRKQAGSALRNASLLKFSRMLANIEGIQRRRISAGSEYLVRKL